MDDLDSKIKDCLQFGIDIIDFKFGLQLDFNQSLESISVALSKQNPEVGQLFDRYLEKYKDWYIQNETLRKEQFENNSLTANQEFIQLICNRDEASKSLVRAIYAAPSA
jgi:hypothetical protein